MPTALAHMAAGPALASLIHPQKKRFLFITLVLFCSVLPDLDVLAFGMGIPYGHIYGHRGFMHSLVFAFLTGTVMAALVYLTHRRGFLHFLQLVIVFFTVTALHGLLDAMTSGGLGVGFFIPFDNSRYFLPFRPVRVSPIGLESFLTRRGLAVLESEMIWVILPSLALMTGTFILKRLLLFIVHRIRAN